MDYNFMGATGVRVSKLAFGTMTFGQEADEATSAGLFARCRDVGINVFDCADVYAKGRSEEILGKLTRECRDEVLITTKAYFPTGPGVNDRGNSRYHLVRAVEASLRRLGTDRIDLFYLHRFDDVTRLDETLRAVEDLIRQGKVLYLGASNFSAWQAMKAVGVAERDGLSRLVCMQPMYNLVKRQAEVEILPMAAAEGLGVFTYSPLAGGLLSGKYGPKLRPNEGRLTKNRMYQTRYQAAANYETAERFTALAQARGVHPAALAVAWVAAHPAVTAPLVGARNLEQLNGVLGAIDIDMTEELYAEISELWPAPPPATDRNEERSANNYGSR
jgi:aryl-alcohol dehydrogenase-like predicted oxidoreductase